MTGATGIVEIVDGQGVLLGTGFVAAQYVITCHHVLDGAAPAIRDAAGNTIPAQVVEDEALARHDLALLEIETVDAVLPIEPATGVPRELLLRGFGLGAIGYRSSVPVLAAVTGATSIEYQTKLRTYKLDEVWQLHRADIVPGFSGGPAIGPEGVAIGVTVAQHAGRATAFVVPFSQVAMVQRFAALLEDNRLRVPRGGAYTDVRSAIALLARRCADRVDWLRELRQFVDEWSVEREEANATAAKFLNERALILPVVGATGTGKTFLLTQLALTTTMPALLLLARDIKPNWDLSDAVADTLAADGQVVARCLQHLQQQGRWVILLDGLNELQLSVDQIRSWFLRAAKWARERQAALVVSCRTELWQLLESSVPQDWLGQHSVPTEGGGARSEQDAVSLSAFTLDEAARARDAYHLTAAWTELREPALIRVAAELGAKRAVARWNVIDAFLRQRCEAAAAAMNLTRDAVAIQTILENLATRCLDSVDGLTLTVEEAEAAAGGEQGVLQALVKQALLVRGDRTVRFAFDWVVEHLQGRRVDLEEALRALDRSKPATSAVLCAAIEFALAQGDVDRASQAMVVALDRMYRDAESVAVLRAVSASFDLVKHGLQQIARGWMGEPSDEVYRFVASVTFSIAQRVELARVLLPHTGYWPWRHKDRELQPSRFEHGGALFHVFRVLLAEDIEATVRSVMPWLGDATRMREGEGSPDEVATAVMVQAERIDHQAIVDLLALEWPSTGSVLSEIAWRSQAEVAADLGRWATEPGGARHAALDGLVERQLQMRPELADVAVQAFRRNGNESLAATLVVLGRSDEGLWQACERGVREGRVHPQKVVPLLSQRFEQVMEWLDAAAKIPARARDVAGALAAANLTGERFQYLLDNLRQLLELDRYGAAYIVEDLLRSTQPAAAASSGLAALALELTAHDDGARACMKYFAYGLPVRNIDPALQLQMAQVLAERVANDDLAELVKIGGSNGNYPAAIIALEEALRRGADVAARAVLVAAWLGYNKTNPLVPWIREHAASMPAVARWLSAVDAGAEPSAAALERLDEME
jgi:hypothetical protein